MALGTQLRDLRQAANIQQADLAPRMGCTASYLSLMERGLRPISLEWYAKALLSISDLRAEARERYAQATTNIGCEPSIEPEPEPATQGVGE